MTATSYFITGTDTDAGKTYVTCLLIEALRREGRDAVGYKPIVCGERADAHYLQRASGGDLDIDQINPVWFRSPAAPLAASLLENRQVDVQAMRDGFQTLRDSHEQVLVEGAGGWEVPLTADSTLADFAQDLQLPILLVANNRLGMLNHTLLTLRSIRERGLTCAGILLNYVQEERDMASISARMVLEQSTEIPVLAEIMHGETEIDWPLD